MGRPKGSSTDYESHMIKTLNEGEVFYTQKVDKTITAIASYYQKKVKTERLIIVSGSFTLPLCDTITKVTMT
jgi:hypothetical protein